MKTVFDSLANVYTNIAIAILVDHASETQRSIYVSAPVRIGGV